MSATTGDRDDPRSIGSYHIVRRIGAGGMAVVYEAVQERPRRRVAIKVLHARLSDSSAHQRFLLESQLLGQLNHAAIAAVYEIGLHDTDGQSVPFIVMEFIQGAQSIIRYADSAGLDRDARLTLFLHACEAVQHGHQHGVIHRDIKPDNILVDETGRLKVIDYGVARVFDREREHALTDTGDGHLIGTLAYMSPEQMSGESGALDTRADIYALGTVLYELLCGRPPHNLIGCDYFTAVERVASATPTRIGAVDPACRGDLELVVSKALAREKDQRYATAAELAADLRRVLVDQPIAARPQTLMAHVRTIARRHKGAVAGALTAVVAVVVGLIVALDQTARATTALNEARSRAGVSERYAYRMSIATASAALAGHDVARARLSLDQAPPDLREWEWHHLYSRLDYSRGTIHLGPARRNGAAWLGMRGGRLVATVQSTVGVERYGVDGDGSPEPLADAGALYTLAPAGDVEALLADRTLTVSADGAAPQAWSLDAWGIDETARISALEITPDGGAVVLGSDDNVWCIDLASQHVHRRPLERRGARLLAMACHLGPRVCLASGDHGRPMIWDVATDRVLALNAAGKFVRSVAFSPDGRFVAMGQHDTTVGVWDTHTGARIATGHGHQHAVTSVTFSPDGHTVASVSLDRTVRMWDARDLTAQAVLHGHESGIWFARFAPDGTILATTGEDGGVRLWDATRATEPGILAGHTSYVYPAVFSPDGLRVASAAWDDTVRVWDVVTERPVMEFTIDERLRPVSGTNSPIDLAFSSDGRRLAAVHRDALRVWDLDRGQCIVEWVPEAHDWLQLDLPGSLRLPLMFLADGQAIPLVWAIRGATVPVLNITTRAIDRRPLTCLADVASPAISSDGRWLLAPNLDSPAGRPWRAVNPRAAVFVIDLASGRRAVLPEIALPAAFRRAGAGGPVVAATRRQDPAEVVLLDVETGEALGRITGPENDVYGLAWSPDGRRLAVGRAGPVIRLWDPVRAEEVAQLFGHDAYVWSVDFSPDGRRLVSGSGDHTVRIWGSSDMAPGASRYNRDHDRPTAAQPDRSGDRDSHPHP